MVEVSGSAMSVTMDPTGTFCGVMYCIVKYRIEDSTGTVVQQCSTEWMGIQKWMSLCRLQKEVLLEEAMGGDRMKKR